MAKDFDFIPAKPSRKRVGRTTPVARPIPQRTTQRKKRTAPPKPHTPTAPPQLARHMQTRSSLIDYHPMQVSPQAKKAATPKPAMIRNTATTATTAHAAPPYLPPARNIPTIATEPKKRLNKKTVVSTLVGFVVIVLLASGLLIPLLENPSITIIIYIIAAIIFRLNSRVSFSIALLLLLAIPVLLLIRNGALAGTYAIFCFYFLVVGVISATIELRKTDH